MPSYQQHIIYLACFVNQCEAVNASLFDLIVRTTLPLSINMDAVRMPRNGMIHGAQIVLPALPDGGLEIVAGIEEQFLERLLLDPILMKFAVPR